MKKTVYVIMCSSGHWDSYHTWIGGIFDDPIKAEESCKILNDEAKLILDQCPVKTKEDDMTDEEGAIYYKWYAANQEAVEWGEAKVKEFNLNEICKHDRLG